MNTADKSVQLDNKNFLLRQRIFIKNSPEQNDRIKKRLYFYLPLLTLGALMHQQRTFRAFNEFYRMNENICYLRLC